VALSPLGIPKRWLLAVAAMMATLLYAIDTTIVSVALPHMQGSLQASQNQAAWLVTAYIVASAIATPLAGYLGTRFGLRRVLLVAIVGFTAGSLLCAVSTGLGEMVVFRMMQGVFGAALVPLSQVALLQEFPRESHGRVMAMWGVGVMVGPVIGPALGGWLTEELSWRWCFYVNLPVGVLAALGIMFAMAKDHTAPSRPFDVKGFIMLSLAIGLLQLMLDRGETADWFGSAEIVGEAFFSAVFLYMFVVHSLTSPHPFVDIHLFRDRNFTVALLLQFVTGLFLFCTGVLLPNFLQSLQGYNPAQAGTLLATRGFAAVITMLICGQFASRLEPRLTIIFGLGLVALSLWLMAGFNLDTPAHTFMLVGFLQGLGMPLSFMPLTLVAFTTLHESNRTEAGTLLTLARSIGGAGGIAATVALLSSSAQTNQSYLVEHFTAYSADRWQAIGAAAGANTSTVGLMAEIGRQSMAIAYSNDFHLLAGVSLIAVPLVFLLRSTKPYVSSRR
jgi:MFS transporter, DHA2 family, multidrug resistance protein